MKKKVSIFLTGAAMCGIVFFLSSCEDCYTCSIIDEDNILDETGDSCDPDFVDHCEDMEFWFDDVICTC
jgi:hypothetical protein